MAVNGAGIQVAGLKEFQRSLKAMDTNLPKQLRIALNSASELVIDDARRRVPTRSGRAAKSLKVRSTQREARVAAGGRIAPYYPWLDFGGHVGQHGKTTRPFYKEGRYIYPSLRENREKIIEVMGEALADLAREAGLVVS